MTTNTEQHEQPFFPVPVVDQNGHTAEDEQFFDIDRNTWVRVADIGNGKFIYQKIIKGYPMPLYKSSDMFPDILTYRNWREMMEGKPWNQIVQQNTPKQT